MVPYMTCPGNHEWHYNFSNYRFNDKDCYHCYDCYHDCYDCYYCYHCHNHHYFHHYCPVLHNDDVLFSEQGLENQCQEGRRTCFSALTWDRWALFFFSGWWRSCLGALCFCFHWVLLLPQFWHQPGQPFTNMTNLEWSIIRYRHEELSSHELSYKHIRNPKQVVRQYQWLEADLSKVK